MENRSIRPTVNILLGLLFVIGIGLIVWIFFFLFNGGGDHRGMGATAWLNMFVIIFMFVITFGGFWVLSARAGANTDVLPAHLAIGSFIFIYDGLALAVIVASVIGLDFKFSLIAQLVLAFIFAVIFVVTLSGVGFAKMVAEGEANERVSAEGIKNEVRRLQLKFKALPADFSELSKLYDALADDAKHITPNSTDEALTYDNDIMSEIGVLKGILEESPSDKEDFINKVKGKIEGLRNLIEARKKVYSR